MAEVVLPAMDVSQEAKTKSLLDKISEFMGCKYEIESIIVMKIKFHEDRQDFGTVVRKLVSKAIISSQKSKPDAPVEKK
jgi:hypothetical protein